MRLSNSSTSRTPMSGHASAAMQIPETEWYLPEGSTRDPYREVLAILNLPI